MRYRHSNRRGSFSLTNGYSHTSTRQNDKNVCPPSIMKKITTDDTLSAVSKAITSTVTSFVEDKQSATENHATWTMAQYNQRKESL